MDNGKKDRRLVILRAPVIDDGLQRRPGDPEPFLKAWAEAKAVSDGERLAGGAATSSLAYRFRINWSRQGERIDTRDLVQFEGRVFGISGVKALGRQDDIEITAVTRGEKPR